MQRLFFFLSFFLLTFYSNAQLDRKDFMVGGSLGFSTIHKGDLSHNSLNLSPNIGYFFWNHIPAGLDFSWIQEGNNMQLAAAPYIRGYLKIGSAALFGYLKCGVSTTRQGQDKTTNSFFAAGPGLAAFISRDVALETIFSYTRQLDSPIYSTAFTIGIQVYICRK
jgi:hypothetical protein